MKYKNLIYFQNGSMGDFLMTIFFLENVYLNNPELNLYVVVPKSEKLLQQFLEKYSYIKIILVNRKSYKGISGMIKLLKFYFSSNLVLTAPTPGKLSLLVKLQAKMIALMPYSKLVGFDDGEKINETIYNEVLDYHTDIIYPEFLKQVLLSLGFEIKIENPLFRYQKDENILKRMDLTENSFVVINPLAATQGRSLNGKEMSDFIKEIKKINNNLKIVLTGGGNDSEILQNFSKIFDNVFVFVNLRITDLCNLIEGANLFVGVDTGTTHLASFLNKKSLVIAKNGTPNWLPYYNKNARILFSINNCNQVIYEGRDFLEKNRGSKLRCLENVPVEVVKRSLGEILTK
ncbi:MAG: glycosyltransferase family 9 protein [Patescibacteria group bacterium]